MQGGRPNGCPRFSSCGPCHAIAVAVAHFASLTGPRERNEDFCGSRHARWPGAKPRASSRRCRRRIGARGGREAVEYTGVAACSADYYATPDTWAVPRAIETVTTALNRWVIAEASRNAELAGMATTLSALVLRGRRYPAHIGDSRIYRMQRRAARCADRRPHLGTTRNSGTCCRAPSASTRAC